MSPIRAAVPGYSLAPEHAYPTPIKQAAAAIAYLEAHAAELGADPEKVFIGGNSAGAQIASQLGALITNPVYRSNIGLSVSLPPASLRGLLLFNGVYDFDTVGRDRFPGFRMFAWSYTGRRDYENFSKLDQLSTVRNISSTYPATFLTAGDADPIEAQTYQFDAVLRSHHIDVTSLYWTGTGRGLPHDYIYHLDNQAAQIAYRDVLHFLATHAQ